MHKGLINYYLPATVGYSVIRKTLQVKDATVTHYDTKQCKRIKVPMFVTDKAALVAFSALACIYGWPMFAVQDLNEFECKVRGLNSEFYNITEKQYVADYLLS